MNELVGNASNRSLPSRKFGKLYQFESFQWDVNFFLSSVCIILQLSSGVDKISPVFETVCSRLISKSGKTEGYELTFTAFLREI